MKRSFFQAAVVSILLYGYTAWTLTKRLKKKLDGIYTRMLRAILNIQVRRTRHAGTLLEKQGRNHQWCTSMESRIWPSKSSTTSSNIHTAAMWGYGCSPEDLPEAMNDREKWRERVRDIRASGRTWWCWRFYKSPIIFSIRKKNSISVSSQESMLFVETYRTKLINYTHTHTHTHTHGGGWPRGVMVKAIDCGIVAREFVLQSRYYIHFRANAFGKSTNPLLLPAMG